MSKKTPVKKSRRRLKRSIRRSLAAVLMITAIAVAAIPVPENYAADEDTPAAGDDEPKLPYIYDSDSYEVIKFPDVSSKLSPVKVEDETETSKPSYKTHYIFLDGTTYRMEWQFEYFMESIKGNDKGIISKYNDAYTTKLLEVNTNSIGDYDVVYQTDAHKTAVTGKPLDSALDRETLDAFKARVAAEITGEGGSGGGGTGGSGGAPIVSINSDYAFTLENGRRPDLSVPEDARFALYFPDEYAKKMAEWDEYEKYLEDRKTLLNQGLSETEVDAQLPKVNRPSVVTLTPLDFSDRNDDESWRRYYCENEKHKKLDGYILMKVADSELTTALGSSKNVYSYVPQRIELDKRVDGIDDDAGFRYKNDAPLMGIGNDAFKGVKNVQNISLPEDLKYIGDNAFEGSFIQSIKMDNVECVGNYAFRGCPRLSKVEMTNGVTMIGKEAFYGVQNLKEMIFPAAIEYIGPAAFAECIGLNKLDFSALSRDLVIDDYAFYNDVALSDIAINKPGTESETVTIIGIGQGAFAVLSSVTGSLVDFVFPTSIKTNKNGEYGIGVAGLGDYVLAGRTNLQHVTMPSDYGSTGAITLPNDLFFNCIALESVEFPATGNSCGMVKFAKDLFDTVSNPNFYVQGPEFVSPSSDQEAYPRTSTWDAYTAVSKTVPYVYYKNGVRYSEISDGDYLECIDENGVLISCTLSPNANPDKIEKDGVVLVIPAEVGGKPVTGIATGCFTDDRLNNNVVSLTFIDGSQITSIADSVFAGWKRLEKVYINDSIRSIGNSAFQGCSQLIDVTFNTPESAAGEFKVGTAAFQTNGLELTFHGMINSSFAPYTWATDVGNKIDTDRGVRVCYKSLAPSSLTVMYDDATGKLTLLDYPKYDQVPELLGEQYATKYGVDWRREGYSSAAKYYQEYMEQMYYNLYRSTQYNNKRKAFAKVWKDAKDADVENLYKDFNLYGPWIYDGWNPEDEVTSSESSSSGSSSSESTGGETSSDESTKSGGRDTVKAAFDWLFEPLVAEAAPSKDLLKPYFDVYPYNVIENYERNSADAAGPYQSYTMDEWNAFSATQNIVVPDGVTSIDVNAYMNAGQNNANATTYLTVGRLGADTHGMYKLSSGEADDYTDRENDHVGGLFSGEYKDYATTGDTVDSREELKKGNDRLTSIDLNGVTTLPAYAFDSCENLQTVKIGAACTDIGTLPFRGCTSLTDVQVAEGNPKYVSDNRVVYSKDETTKPGTTLYKIEECLETRGWGSESNPMLDSGLDGNLASVSEIADGAFEACNYVEEVNLTDAANLRVIPERTFKKCELLERIKLPATVNKIDKDAFSLSNELASIRIPGREVFISTEAFEDNNKARTSIVTYEDSSARRYADTYADQYKLRWDNIGDLWEVAFFDMDGAQIGDTISVENNTRLTDDQIPIPPERPGYTFVKWVGTGGIDVDAPIEQPTNFIAQYDSNGGMVGGKYKVWFIDGLDGSLLAMGGEGLNPVDGCYYLEPGTSFAENNMTPPDYREHDGKTFLAWSGNWTVNTVMDGSVSIPIIALYSDNGSTTPTPGGTPGTSTGTTTNTSKKSTSSSTSSTSTSSSSTSSSSTTSGSSSEKAFYTVTVENGHGSGSYAAGSTVIIAANTPAAGMQFSKWTTESNGVNLASVSMTATTFTMPENNVTVTANYVTAGTPTATPVSGTGTTTPASDEGNTRVDITKPGISNKDLATADVNGSTDNFIVKISETDEATQAVSAALLNKYGNLDNILYYAMDISLYDSTGTTKITDTSGLSIDITIPIPDALITYGGNNMAGAVVNGSQLEDLSERFTTVNGVPMITFTATHFSPYTIYVDTGNLVAGELDVTPKTGDPIHPKWFLSIGLACLSVILFIKKDKTRVKVKV